jgi:hypothetical protein
MQFFEFSYAYHFGTNHRRELGDPSFCSECFALSDEYILKRFCYTPPVPESSVEWFSGKLSSQSFF